MNDVQLLSSQLLSNNNFGIVLWAGAGPITNVTIDGNSLAGAKGGIAI